jgi:hypothetical protein
MTDKELIRARCGENQQITDGNYDKTDNVIAYKGSFQPVTKDDRGALAVLGEDLSAHEVFYFLTS